MDVAGAGAGSKWKGWPGEFCNKCGLVSKMNGSGKEPEGLYIRLRQCQRCKKVRYCKRECQMSDWKAHKEHCFPKGQEPPPPMPDERRARIEEDLLEKGIHITAIAAGPDESVEPGDDDPILVHTIGCRDSSCGEQPELYCHLPARRLLDACAGTLVYLHKERTLAKGAPVQHEEEVKVNGCVWRVNVLSPGSGVGSELAAANQNELKEARAFYKLGSADPLLQAVEIKMVGGTTTAATSAPSNEESGGA